MTMLYATLQDAAIALAVAWSASYAARRLAPTASRRAQARVASWMEQASRPAWLRSVGARLQPVQSMSGGCGSSGCSTCGACAPKAQGEAQPLVFHPRSK